MPRMVHFWEKICTSVWYRVERAKSGVSGSAGIPTLLKWGQRSTRRSCVISKLASFEDGSFGATMLAGSCHSPRISDSARQCNLVLQVDVPQAR